MPDKYSLAACEQYGRRLAARLGQQHFHAQPAATLDGPALLAFTPLRQLNLLVLHQLLGRWQHEATQLRSPYFDFEAAPVQAALSQLMNVLSRHIAVGRAALEPLLAEAATTTLLLVLDAPAAFGRVLLPPAAPAEAPVPTAYLRERLRYLELGKPLYEGFVASLPTEASLPRAELLRRFGQYQASHPEQLPAPELLLTQLSALLPLAEADLQAATPATAPAPAEAAPPHPAATLAEARAKTAEAAAPVETSLPPVAAPPGSPPVAAPQPVVPSFVAAPDAPAGPPLYEKLKATQPATAPLAARLGEAANGAAPSLAERGAPKVGSLREAISINQRYSFINELFGGENMDYHAAIAHLDELPTAEAALAYVHQELASRHDWSRKEEHVARLLKLIERKFGAA